LDDSQVSRKCFRLLSWWPSWLLPPVSSGEQNAVSFDCAVWGPGGAGKSTFIFNCVQRPHNWCVPCFPADGCVENVCGSGVGLRFQEIPPRLVDKLNLCSGLGFDAVVFVLDAHDRINFEDQCDMLHKILEALSPDVPLLLVASKQDMQGSLTPSQVLAKLQMCRAGESCRDRAWRLQGCICKQYSDSTRRTDDQYSDSTRRTDARADLAETQEGGGVPIGIGWLASVLGSRQR